MAGATAYTFEMKVHYTYIWTIENVSELNFQKILFSPDFTVKSMEMTQWRLGITIYGQNIYFYVYRIKGSGEPEQIKIYYEFAFLGVDGLPLIKNGDTGVFLRSGHKEFPNFIKTDEVFSRKKAEFLPKDVLTVRCRMWRRGEIPEPDVCYARTYFKVDRHRFVWIISDFTTLPLEHKITRVLKSTSEGFPDHTLNFCLRETGGEVYACVDFDVGFMGINDAVKGEISLLNVDGAVVQSRNITQCIEKRHIFLNAFFFAKQSLLSNKTALLPSDMLSLRCEFEICYGPLWSQIEKTIRCSVPELESSKYRAIRRILQNKGFADVKEKIVEESTETGTGDCPFKQNLHTFYQDGTLSDVSLKADSETFPVHKIILSSRSPVFKAMFTNNMREKATRSIDVTDVDACTLRRLLSYIYTNEMPEIEWDKIADLLTAADKYELLDLKQKCSVILKSSICSTNVCFLLSLADLHQESELYNAVLDFVSQNFDIFSSEMWNTFKKESPELAMKAMERIIYIKNFK